LEPDNNEPLIDVDAEPMVSIKPTIYSPTLIPIGKFLKYNPLAVLIFLSLVYTSQALQVIFPEFMSKPLGLTFGFLLSAGGFVGGLFYTMSETINNIKVD
jgi:hypothetical protein